MQKDNGEERLVKTAVRTQYEMGEKGNLLMDAPKTQSFKEIEELAQDRAAWRRIVEARFGTRPRRRRKRKRVKKAPTIAILPRQPLAVRAIPTPTTPTITVMRANEMVQSNLPTTWQTTASRQAPNKQAKAKLIKSRTDKQRNKAKKKTSTLTDGQRAAWAHAHFIINHGTYEDAAKFLTHQKNVARTPAAALHEVKVMARRRVPTWKEAKEAVFSSS